MNNLKKLREESGLTQAQLAEQIDCSKRSIIRWENGERFATADVIVKVAEVLNVSADILLGLEEIKA